jgi:hypothetical protein
MKNVDKPQKREGDEQIISYFERETPIMICDDDDVYANGRGC